MKSRRFNMIAFVLLCLVPATAYANAGTPLMWKTLGHLVFGNAVIGLVEGLAIGLVLRHRGRSLLKDVGLMVLANYISAWAGLFLFVGAETAKDPAGTSIYHQSTYIWRTIGAIYGVTLLLEWPFVALCFWKTKHRLTKSLAANVVVQTATCALIFMFYAASSNTTLVTDLQPVPAEEIVLPQGLEIYYIGRSDGDVYRQRAGKDERIFDLNATDGNERLAIVPAKESDSTGCLVATTGSDGVGTVVDTDLSDRVTTPGSRNEELPAVWGTWFNFTDHRMPRLGSARQSPWEFQLDFWPGNGLTATNSESGETLRYAFETPIIAWALRNGIHLPGDMILCQVGSRQVCIIDIPGRRIARVARGRGPTAVLRTPEGVQVPTPEVAQENDPAGQPSDSERPLPEGEPPFDTRMKSAEGDVSAGGGAR